MSELTYRVLRLVQDKPIVWLAGEVKTPPFTEDGRKEAGFRLRLLQQGVRVGMPHVRPMPVIGPGCHELRIRDDGHNWRIVFRIDRDAIVVAEVFDKKTRRTPHETVAVCRRRLQTYDAAAREESEK